MKNIKIIKLLTIINGFILIAMGTFHMYAITMVYPGMIEKVGIEEGIKSAYFFAAMGLALLFVGITIIYSVTKLTADLKAMKIMIFIQNVFVIITTVAAAFCDMGHILTMILIAVSIINLSALLLKTNYSLLMRIKG